MNVKSKPANVRAVIANISLSLDGRVTGPGGEYDMGWIVDHTRDPTRYHTDGGTGSALRAVNDFLRVLRGSVVVIKKAGRAVAGHAR